MLWLWQAGAFSKLRIGERPPQPRLTVSWMGARQPASTVPPSFAKVPTPDIPVTKPPERKPELEPTPAAEERSPEPARAADERMAK